MEEEVKQESLSENQVNDVLKAFDFLEFSDSYKNTYYHPFLTPDIVNRQIQNINMNPVEANIDGIENALKNVKSSESILRGYSQSFEVKNIFYKNIIRYFSDLGAFNLTFDCINTKDNSDFNSPAFKKDLKVLDDFCGKFDFKEEFATVLRQLLRQGVFYCVMRNDGTKYTLQELPPDFCKITGRHSYGLLFDFNFAWFIGNYGVDINMYPKCFKKMYNDIFNKISDKYNPALDVTKRNSTFVYWHQCNPTDGFWAFKINPEVASLVPYFAALFPDMSMQPTIRKLQTDKYFIEASKLLVGIIGMNKDKKSGVTTNSTNITPDVLGKFLGVARQGLAKQIGLTALPMDDIKAVEFDTSKSNMLSDYNTNLANQTVSASEALVSSDKLNVQQSKLASAVDSNFVKAIYPIFENFVEYYVNSQTKKYKFKITFNDFNTPDDLSAREDKFTKLAAMGIVDFQQVSRMYDMNPFELNRHMALSNSMGFTKNLVTLMSLNNQSPQDMPQKPAGRESKQNSDNENTQSSIARGTNDLKE